MRYGSLCSGIEAASEAWRPLGWRAAWFAEINPFASAVLAHRHPDTPNLGDMTAHDFTDRAAGLGAIDLLVACTPCQSFSVAGLRRSLSDDRGNLALRFCRIADELDPRWLVWENVPGVLNTADNAFGCLLAGLVGDSEPLVSWLPDGKWPNAGLVVGPRRAAAWRVLDAQYFRLAQRRRRVYVVAQRAGNGDGPAAVLFESDSLPRHSPPRRPSGPPVAALTANGVGTCGADDTQAQAWHLIPAPAISPALKARDCKGPSSDGDGDGAPLIAHTLRGEGFDASEDGTGRGTPLVAYSIQERAVSLNLNNGPQGKGYQEGIAYTLEARNKVQAIAFGWNKSASRTMRIDETTDAPQASPTSNPAALCDMCVRRLTPVECERLMGFRDNHTRVPYRGRPAEQCPDGPRYRAIGNSMPVTVMAWLGSRIDAVDTIMGEGR